MQLRSCLLAAAALLAAPGLLAAPARADDQTVVGFGNADATATASHSPLVMSAYARLKDRLQATITNKLILKQTMDGLFNPATCVEHRANLTVAQKQAIVTQLVAAGLVNPNDGASITGGIYAGIFPALINDADGANSCPNLPLPFYAAAGSGNGSHHSYPGGLPIHESFNTSSAFTFADNYRNVYGRTDKAGLPVVGPIGEPAPADAFTLDENIVVATPMWHDWAKPMVFQFTAAGTLFMELAFGGAGSTDNNGAAGDSRTGGHHILSLAETIKRGFPADFVITQASAHAAPTLGNEYKVVNWLRAAAIIDQIDPVAAGLLTKDANGNFRLPPLRHLGDLSLPTAGQGNILPEYPLHNLSDADFVFTIPAVNDADVILQAEAAKFGYDPVGNPVAYQTKFRNVAMSYLSAERIQDTYANSGLHAVMELLKILRGRGAI
jgi:hypothetical protein